MASRGLNKVLLIGNLGADPEMRYTPTGKAVTTLRIAVNRTWRDQSSGEQQKDTQWFNIVTWEQLAEFCSRYLAKGRSVYVEGRLQTRSWDAPDGSKRYMTEVVAQEIILLDRAPSAGAPEGGLPVESDDLDQPSFEEELPF
jgi:single-strand DNA-binding protein